MDAGRDPGGPASPEERSTELPDDPLGDVAPKQQAERPGDAARRRARKLSRKERDWDEAWDRRNRDQPKTG